MAKIDSKELVKRIKTKEKPERANVTFRLNTALMDDFKAACKAQDVTPTAVIEEYMTAFVVDMGKKTK